MRLQSLGERELISAIRKEFSDTRPDVLLGIGDDAAVVRPGKSPLLLTKDLLLEGFHFIRGLHPPYFLGRKSLNINLSDIAAMGGVPKFALLGLGLPASLDTAWLRDYFAGFKSAVKQGKVALLGGDVSESKKIFISVTVIGEGKNIVQRKGALPGHLVFVSGYLGDSRQGLILHRQGIKLGKNKKTDSLLRSFLDPVPQVSLGQALSRQRLVSSMIDVSDGLSVDLFHLCQESRLGAEIYLEKLPISPELRAFQKNPSGFALHGGEDYQLLFTISHQDSEALSKLQKKFMLTFIGKMTRKREICVIDRRGKRMPLEIKGYEHFVNKRRTAPRRKRIRIF